MVNGDELQLEQVFSNIIKNSMEAIEQEGNINIYTYSNPSTIVFEDDGSGISQEVEPQLFKPFFSTKPTGQGVGLMLIREILQNHMAEFKLTTDKISRKTRFTIRFQR
jgi:signal transduction histidine kinase